MGILKKILAFIAILLVLIIGAAVAIPYFFKDDILVALREEINKNVNAEVDFADIDLSLLRSFPDFSLAIKDYSALGKDDFAGVMLAKGESLDLTLDIWSVINADTPIQLKSVNLDAPNLHIVVTRDGKANYDIFAATSDTATTTSEFVIQLDNYSIENGQIIYDDRTIPVYVEMKDVNHSGSGNFTQDVYDLATTTNINSFTTRYDGITYLTKAKTNLAATININNQTARYTLKENELTVNDLTVTADGWLEMAGDNMEMDLKFSTPENDFRSLFSLIPAAYIADYQDVDVKGQFDLAGMAQGVFNSKTEQYPTFKINMNVTDGDVKYPDLPLGISDVYTSLDVNHPGGNLNKMVVDVDNFRLKIGNNPINGRFKLRTPLSDPDMDARVKGKLDLAELAQAFPMEGVEQINGIINADVTVDARMSAIDSGNYQNVEMEGSASVENVNYNAAGIPAVKVNSLAMDFSPTKVTINNFNTNLGKSDLRGSGQVDNFLAFFATDKTMTGKFDLVSTYFDADEWLVTDETATTSNSATTAPTEESVPFENFAFDFDVVMDKIDYDIYNLSNLAGEGKIASNTLTISEFYTQVNGSDIRARGTINNVLNFINYNEGISGNLNFVANYLDLDALAGASDESATPATETTVGEIPDIKYDLDLNGTAKKVKYDIYTLTDVSLDGNINEKQVKINDFKGDLGKSDLAGSGVINDYMEYVFKNETVSGTLDVTSNFFDANEFLAEDPNAIATTNPTETAIVPIPPNMAFDINADVDEVLYTNVRLRNLKGKIVLAEEAVMMDDVTLETLGGKVALAGSYDTKDIENPGFSFKYDLQDLKFKESFNTLNTFAAAAPIAKYLNGAFNSTLVMDGTLGKDLLPKLSSLSADGFLQTLQATLDGFIPFEKIGKKLG
ncbi:MAG: AsmA-like C-terminal region-containing protein, partial [Saprospiraceae bacterium]